MNTAKLLKHIDQLVGPMLTQLLGSPQQKVELATLEATPGKILLIRPGGIGDMVMLLPTLKALREALPEREIEIICESRNADILKLLPLNIRPLCYNKSPLALLKMLRKNHYAAVFDCEQFHHFSAVFSALSKAPLRVGFNINPRRNGIYTHLQRYDLSGREDLQFLQLVRSLLPNLKPASLAGILPELKDIVPELPASFSTGRYFAMHAGGSHPSKRWPAERMAEVIAEMWKRHNLPTVLLGGKDDLSYATEIQNLCKTMGMDAEAQPTLATGKWTLVESIAILQMSRLFFGPDSGLAHLATALDVPSLTLFGPSDPQKWSIPSARQRQIRRELPCSPCSIFGYIKPCQVMSCLHEVSTTQVLNLLDQLITSSS